MIYTLIGTTRAGNMRCLAVLSTRKQAARAFATASRRNYRAMSLLCKYKRGGNIYETELMKWEAPAEKARHAAAVAAVAALARLKAEVLAVPHVIPRYNALPKAGFGA